MIIQDNVSAVINKYGSNMVNSKYDPLSEVEAKRALNAGNNSVADDILGIQKEGDKQKQVNLGVELGKGGQCFLSKPQERYSGFFSYLCV